MRKFLALGDPIVPPYYAAELLRLLEARGVDAPALLREMGMEPAMLASPRCRLSYRQLRLLILSALRGTRDRTLGLAFGERVVVGRWGPLGHAVLSAPNLGQALVLIERYSSLLVPHVEVSRVEEGRQTRLVFSQFVRLGALRHFVTEALVSAVVAQLRLAVSGPLPVRRIRFDYPEPAHAEAYACLGCAVEFGAESLEITWDTASLQMPLRFACAPAAVSAEQQCAAEVNDSQARKSVVSQVRQLLRERDDGFPDARSAARRLQTSERSLRRALHESGTSFQALVDDTRRELAMEYLRSTQASVQDIARITGFSDGRSFRRAFKRWTGMTPAEARRTDGDYGGWASQACDG